MTTCRWIGTCKKVAMAISPSPSSLRLLHPGSPAVLSSCNPFLLPYKTSSRRSFRTTPLCAVSSSSPDGLPPPPRSTLNRLEDANPERIHGIQVNPDSLGNEILPGNLIYKAYRWTGNVRKIPVELAKGYFWMVSDLKKTNQKPTLSNESLIPERDAQMFPTLTGLNTLAEPKTSVNLPWYFLDPELSGKNVSGKITLVAITFRDNGFKLLPSWIEPFEQAFQKDPSSTSRVQTYKVTITEHWVLYPLSGILTRVMKSNTPPAEQSKTLVYFGSKDVDDFRDVLRMHNIMTSYVFLLDDLGRVRFAGSGQGSVNEVSRLIEFTKELISESDGGKSGKQDSQKGKQKARKST